MSLVNRLQTHYGWTPNFHLESKKQGHLEHNSGWIVLTIENNRPVCLFITNKLTKYLSIVLDERLFSDTIFKVEQTSRNTYNILDVWLYNSSCIYAGTSYSQRSLWIDSILEIFHKSFDGLTQLTHLKPNIMTVLKTQIPDVYNIKDHEGYIQIPDLKTSRFLRLKGDVFQLNCKKEGEYWVIQENIPDVK